MAHPPFKIGYRSGLRDILRDAVIHDLRGFNADIDWHRVVAFQGWRHVSTIPLTFFSTPETKVVNAQQDADRRSRMSGCGDGLTDRLRDLDEMGIDLQYPLLFQHVIGNPFETALALHCLIFEGVLERHPNLRILVRRWPSVNPLGWIMTRAPSSSALAQKGANTGADSSRPATFVSTCVAKQPCRLRSFTANAWRRL
jgi:hypothetical protein